MLKNSASKLLVDIEHPDRGYPIQQACKKGLVKGLPLVTIILKYCGDIRVDRILHLQDPDSNDVLLKSYPSLSSNELSCCSVCALSKYKYDRAERSYPNEGNPMLNAMILLEQWKQQVRRSDPKLQSN